MPRSTEDRHCFSSHHMQTMAKASLTDLPPELLDHIIEYLPTANTVANLGASSKSLQGLVEKNAWATFNRIHFPSFQPSTTPSQKGTARTLTSLSKAWDRRAFTTQYIEPQADITAYPGGKKVERWKRPRGQTIGFTPQLDCYEEVGQKWDEREEVLAFSAGAEVCVRKKGRRRSREDVKWMTYRPLSAYEGRDDITTLQLLRPKASDVAEDEKVSEKVQRLITGTANGDLWILSLPEGSSGDVPITYFVTNGQPVRSSGLWTRGNDEKDLLVASTGDSRASIYSVDPSAPKIGPLSSIDIHPPRSNGHAANYQRVWSSKFLSPSKVAAGIGPSSEPIHVYDLLSSGLSKEPLRKFSLQNTLGSQPSDDDSVAPVGKKRSSSVYPIVPLPPSSSAAGSSHEGCVFLSGGYDGIIRLHDLRSNKDVEVMYTDPTDESAIYSLLSRGRETLVAGGSRHSMLKFFDLRLGGKCYDYRDAAASPSTSSPTTPVDLTARQSQDWNLFLRPHNINAASTRGGNSWAALRGFESSVYTLASPSPTSPFLYAGVENAVLELGFTSILDPHPDPAFFPLATSRRGTEPAKGGEGLDLAMYDQVASMKLLTQRSVPETLGLAGRGREGEKERGVVEGLDERWRVGSGEHGAWWERGSQVT